MLILIGELLTKQEIILQLTAAINFIPNDCDGTMQGPALCTLDPLHDTTTVYGNVLHPEHKHAQEDPRNKSMSFEIMFY